MRDFYQSDCAPHVLSPVLKSLDDVETLNIPDPERTFPLNELLKATRILVRETKGEVFVMGRADQGPVALALALCGPEMFLLAAADLSLRPKVLRLLDFTSRMNVVFGEAQRRAGAHGSSIGAVGSSMISPQMYDTLEFPGIKPFATPCVTWDVGALCILVAMRRNSCPTLLRRVLIAWNSTV